jgi:hypothetical protein
MQVTVEIPDDMAQRLTSAGRDPARTLLEALAIEGYRSGALTTCQTRRLPKTGSIQQLKDFSTSSEYRDGFRSNRQVRKPVTENPAEST